MFGRLRKIVFAVEFELKVIRDARIGLLKKLFAVIKLVEFYNKGFADDSGQCVLHFRNISRVREGCCNAAFVEWNWKRNFRIQKWHLTFDSRILSTNVKIAGIRFIAENRCFRMRIGASRVLFWDFSEELCFIIFLLKSIPERNKYGWFQE